MQRVWMNKQQGSLSFGRTTADAITWRGGYYDTNNPEVINALREKHPEMVRSVEDLGLAQDPMGMELQSEGALINGAAVSICPRCLQLVPPAAMPEHMAQHGREVKPAEVLVPVVSAEALGGRRKK